ncbi:hypothetical protein MKZ38_003571 [Zalerion maritima]|uniref:Large ribosomal subunit protein mL50 n=1 Tax=Zalerion maritima TaxID=339359 RepID=A0AAD5RNB8_9PEZI|nr:hypothetical protein MKZ38_003571 [Zalerion maritima]
MRRIPLLRRPCGLSFASSPSVVVPRFSPQVSAPAASATATSTRCISSTPSSWSRAGRFGQPTLDREPEPTPASSLPPQQSTELSETKQLSAEESREVDDLVQSQYDEPTIPLPPRTRTWAPKQEEIKDSSYQPADTGEGLPELKSTNDWFSDDENWDATSQFVGFAPASDERVQDLRILEVLLRRAVVEALVMNQEGKGKSMANTWGMGGRNELVKALGLRVVVKEGGEAEVQGDVKGVLESLEEVDEQPPEEDEEDEEDKWKDEEPADMETEQEAIEEEIAPFVEPEEAAEMCKGWDKTWRNISLDDMGLKFAVTKRIYQLTGHRIHDYKLHSILTVGGLLKVLHSKPKPTKLFEFIEERKPELTNLPNVKVYSRRVTPIDKEKEVGRWKVIERELEKRGLPATGHSHLPKPNQRAWILGKA